MNLTLNLREMGLKTKIFLLLLFSVVTIYQFDELLQRTAKSHTRFQSSTKYKKHGPDPAIVERAHTLIQPYKEHGIVGNLTAETIIDERTSMLVHKSTRLLGDSNWWLNGRCDCDAPIFDHIRQYFLPLGRIVSQKEYWSEVYVSRTIATISHKDAYRESHGKGRISLLTQCTPARRYMLSYIIANWPGPINLAMYVKRKEFDSMVTYLGDLLRDTGRMNIIAHVVIRTGDLYPVNWLRNLVLKNTTSEYVFTIDIDFIPSKNLMSSITKHLKGLQDTQSVILLVPAMEIVDSSVKELPLNKSSLIPYLTSKQADVFHRKAAGQTLWLLDKWMSSNNSYLLPKGKICDDKSEPYLIVERTKSPNYPETLVERGKNKIAYYVELCTYGNSFLVISDAFLLHMWHDVSLRALSRVEYCMINSFETFKQHLARKVGDPRMYDPLTPMSLQRLFYGLRCIFVDFCICLLFISPIVIVFMYFYYKRCRRKNETII